ncbi:hypothetical protein RHMOL_Rhmol01G0238200 [Rhododendron molle]|uniref:Uncharacterized protein n=1 Tax=Rhododendron molle TaxID=49168 RepID=A0ACC0Q4J7_RHOML|nr:hypothetical protein RHMOL_Rhmol01G0238200 [Rhododendron molle]
MVDILESELAFFPHCDGSLVQLLTVKKMDAEVDYLYLLLAKQDAYGPIFEELESMQVTIVPSSSPCLDPLTTKEMDGEDEKEFDGKGELKAQYREKPDEDGD